MDKELDDLLDSALGEFDQKLTIKDENPTKNASKSDVSVERMNVYVDDDLDYEDRPAPKATSAASNATSNTAFDPNFGSNLISDENLKLFEGIFKNSDSEKGADSMKDFKNVFDMFQNSNDEASLLDNFQKVMSELVNEESNLDDEDNDFDNIQELDFLKTLAAAASNTNEPKAEVKPDEKTTTENLSKQEPKKDQTPMQKVLDDMNKNSEKVLKNSANSGFPFGNDFLSSLTQGLNLDENSTGDEGLDGATSMMMQPILSMLFSKEILYPSLKMMLENYDKYIEEKKEKLTDRKSVV